MTKLCARGKAAAKRKFKVYPSAYANAYASKICAGKIKDPSGMKRKDWGPKKAKTGDLMSKENIIIPKKKPKKEKKSERAKGYLMGDAYGNRYKMDYEPTPRYSDGGMARGGGCAIKGKGFKGVF